MTDEIEDLKQENERLRDLVVTSTNKSRLLGDMFESVKHIVYNASLENYEKVQKIKDILDNSYDEQTRE